MINIEKKILFQSTKNGKNSKEDDVNYTLEHELYIKFIKDKGANSVFELATICVYPFKNLLKTLKDSFDYIILLISSDGIRIDTNSSKLPNNILGLSYFTGICGFGDNLPIIKCNRCEKYECSVDTNIAAYLKTSDLDIVIKNITIESTVYLFVNKTEYNTENNDAEASSIEFHIQEEKCKKNGCVKELGYTEIIIPCKKNVDTNKKID